MDFRVRISSWIFELDFELGFFWRFFLAGFFWRVFFGAFFLARFQYILSGFTQRTLSPVLHVFAVKMEEEENVRPVRAILFNLS